MLGRIELALPRVLPLPYPPKQRNPDRLPVTILPCFIPSLVSCMRPYPQKSLFNSGDQVHNNHRIVRHSTKLLNPLLVAFRPFSNGQFGRRRRKTKQCWRPSTTCSADWRMASNAANLRIILWQEVEERFSREAHCQYLPHRVRPSPGQPSFPSWTRGHLALPIRGATLNHNLQD